MVRSSNVAHMLANTDVFDFMIEDADKVLMDSWDEGKLGAVGKHSKDQGIDFPSLIFRKVEDMIAQAQE